MNNPEEQNWASSSNFAPQQIVSVDFEHLRPQIVAILSETANGCISELGYHPNIINDLTQQIASLERDKEGLLSQLKAKDSDNARLFADNRQLFMSREASQRLALDFQLARDNEQRLAKENVAKTEHIKTLQDALRSHNINIDFQQLVHRYNELLDFSKQILAENDRMRAERDFLLPQRRPTLKSIPGPHPPVPRSGVEPSFDASSPNPMGSSQQQSQQHYVPGHNLNPSHNSLSNAIPTPAQMQIQRQQQHQLHTLPQGHPQQVQHPMAQRRSSGNYTHPSPPQQQQQHHQSYVPSRPPPGSQSSSRRSSMHIPSQALPQHQYIQPHVQRPDPQQMHHQQPHSQNPFPQQQAYSQQQSPQQPSHPQQLHQTSPQQQQAPPSLRISTHSRTSQQIPLTPPLSSLHNGPFYTLSPSAQSPFLPPPFNPSVPRPSAPSEHSLAAPPPTPPISHKSMTPEALMDQKPIVDVPPTAVPSSLKRELENDPSECQETKRPKLEESDQQILECVDDNKEAPSEPKRTVWECITDGLERTGTGDDTICRLCIARAEKFSDEPMPMPFVNSIREEITAHFEEYHAYILQRYRLGTL